MARLTPAGGGGLPVGLPLHLPIANMPKNCVLLDGSPMPEWASKAVKDMYGDTLPDYRGRAPVGTNEGTSRIGEAWGDTPGGSGGEDRHILSISEMPQHNHTMSTDGYHGHSGSTNTTGNHRHSTGHYRYGDNYGSDKAVIPSNNNSGGRSYTNYAGNHAHSLSINANGSHKHTINNRGSGASHNNMQPSIVGRWLMKLK